MILVGNDIPFHIHLLDTVEVPVTTRNNFIGVSREADQGRVQGRPNYREVDQSRVQGRPNCREVDQDYKEETMLVSDRDPEIGSFHSIGIIF